MSYYHNYEQRYRTVFKAGAKYWGHSPDDEWLSATLADWVDTNRLHGKLIIEFACGEGACGVILSKLGCRWIGFDAAPSAVEKARNATSGFDTAQVFLQDCVCDDLHKLGLPAADAGLDVMGLHMLVTDADRSAYLANFSSMLKTDAPALFLRESFRTEAYEGAVDTIDDWILINGLDLITPETRIIMTENGKTEVMLPLLAARTRNLEGYTQDFSAAGLKIIHFIPSEPCKQIIFSASFNTRKVK
jgi:hypothetical protein